MSGGSSNGGGSNPSQVVAVGGAGVGGAGITVLGNQITFDPKTSFLTFTGGGPANQYQLGGTYTASGNPLSVDEEVAKKFINLQRIICEMYCIPDMGNTYWNQGNDRPHSNRCARIQDQIKDIISWVDKPEFKASLKKVIFDEAYDEGWTAGYEEGVNEVDQTET